MLSENFKLETPAKKTWSLIPEDMYQVEITNLEEKVEPNKWKERPTDPDEKRYINFEFTIIEEGELYGRRLWQKMSPVRPYPPYGNGKATLLYRLTSAIAGHAFTREEADSFGIKEVNDFAGKQLRVTVKHSVPNAQGKQFANIEGFLAVKAILPVYDETKVPAQNKPEEPSGYDKFKEAAETAKETLQDIRVEDINF